MRKPGLVIFDCDGVLIDSELIGARVEAEELARIGMRISEPEILARFLGMTAKEMYRTLEIEHGMALPPGFAADVQTRIDAAFERDLQAIPGIHEVLDRLAVSVCVASSSTLARLRHSLGLAGLYERFAPHIFSAEQVARGKPAPDLFLYAAAQMACAPEACVVIEDSVSGVRAAVAAGMRVWGFIGGGHCPPGHDARLRDAGAQGVFEHMPDLAGLLA
jgi:HAD superfamily hydrolase (TIGR01509 family)